MKEPFPKLLSTWLARLVAHLHSAASQHATHAHSDEETARCPEAHALLGCAHGLW
jgi:hypothetical protein